jgi:hypothetical protein
LTLDPLAEASGNLAEASGNLAEASGNLAEATKTESGATKTESGARLATLRSWCYLGGGRLAKIAAGLTSIMSFLPTFAAKLGRNQKGIS